MGLCDFFLPQQCIDNSEIQQTDSIAADALSIPPSLDRVVQFTHQTLHFADVQVNLRVAWIDRSGRFEKLKGTVQILLTQHAIGDSSDSLGPLQIQFPRDQGDLPIVGPQTNRSLDILLRQSELGVSGTDLVTKQPCVWVIRTVRNYSFNDRLRSGLEGVSGVAGQK